MDANNFVVLLVDDDTNILHGYARRFRNYDFQLYTARSAEEAMDILKRNKVDVVVSDECMQGITGTTFLAWVAKHFPETARIILTGQPSVPSMTTAINESDVYRYLTKPINAEDLAANIFASIERQLN